MAKRDAVIKAQNLLKVSPDGKWGPITQKAFFASSVSTQQAVLAALMEADLTPTKISAFQMDGGDARKAAFRRDVLPLVIAGAEQRGLNVAVVVGQLNLESAHGSRLSAPFNYAGIKARKDRSGKFIDPHTVAWTNEGSGRGLVRVQQAFRVFSSNQDFVDSYFSLITNARYLKAFKIADISESASAVHKAGYATDPGYTRKLTAAALAAEKRLNVA